MTGDRVVDPATTLAAHADFIDRSTGQRCCTCGMWTSEANGQHSRQSFAAHQLAMLADAGFKVTGPWEPIAEEVS